MRLLDLRLGCSSLDTLGLSGACKAVLCVELAAEASGQPISKVQQIYDVLIYKSYFKVLVKSVHHFVLDNLLIALECLSPSTTS